MQESPPKSKGIPAWELQPPEVPADSFLSVGVDMATERTKTALVAITWTPSEGEGYNGRIERAAHGVDHPELAEILASWPFNVAAIDVPFGWANAYTQMLQDHQKAPLESADLVDNPEHARKWRVEEMAMRATDAFVYDLYGGRPWSASFDMLSATAASWALIEAHLQGHRPVDRSGQYPGKTSPRIVETYPAAQLNAWFEDPSKPNLKRALEIADNYGIDTTLGHDKLRDNEDVRDAFVCAVTAGLMVTRYDECHEMSAQPDGEQAKQEGVIWLHDPGFKPDCRSVWTFDEGFPLDSGFGPLQRRRRARRRSPRPIG